MKELKFTPENLQRHRDAWLSMWGESRNIYGPPTNVHSADRFELFTTRDECKGRFGDLFKVEGWGYFVLESVFTVSEVSFMPKYSNKTPLQIVADYMYKLEGFDTPLQMRNELRHIYGELDDYYIHYLKEVFLDD